MTSASGRLGDPLVALGEFCSGMSANRLPADRQSLLDSTIRCCLYCLALGTLRETSALEGSLATQLQESPKDLMQAMGHAVYESSLGAAVDLDPMSVGPAHLALPATIAACVAAELFNKTSDEEIASAVVAGIEAGTRLRDTVHESRPGTGFHSSGTFGTIAAAAATSRLMGLSPKQFANAIGIAFTRMSGLAINSASSRICLTHFGWAAAHGLEAGWLAANGWDASHDAEAALHAIFPKSSIDLATLEPKDGELRFESATILFKRFPCNAYLNPVVIGLGGLDSDPDRIEVQIPAIPHLNRPKPTNIREARYSAQAVAAISVRFPHVYKSFTESTVKLNVDNALNRMMSRVTVVMDQDAPTDLATASIGIRAWSHGVQILNTTQELRQLTEWSLQHAKDLMRGLASGWVSNVYQLPYAGAHKLAVDRLALEREA